MERKKIRLGLKIFCLLIGVVVLVGTLLAAPEVFAKEKFKVEIYGFRMGTTGYVATFALAEIINAKSDWVEAVAMESVLGSVENARMIIKHPEKQDRMIGYIPNVDMWKILNGKPPFKEPFKDMRSFVLSSNFAMYFMTTNPKIKSIEDMKGKRVGLFKRGGFNEEVAKMLLRYGYGITYDDIRVSHMGFGQIADALIDGTVEVGWASAGTGGDEPREPLPTPAMDRLVTTKQCYLVPVSEEAIDKTRKGWGAPLYAIRTRAKKIGKTMLPEAVAPMSSSGWVVTKHMPDDVVTEIVRIIYENVEEFGKYHASLKTMTKKNIAERAEPGAWFHPAAIRFYESKGLKIGME